MIKKIISLGALLLLIPSNSQTNDTLNSTVFTLAAASAAYVVGRTTTAALCWGAKRSFKSLIPCLSSASNPEQMARPSIETLRSLILEDHIKYTKGTYRNYPLLHCKNNLDWYINRLWWFRFFCLGSSQWQPVQQVMHQLQALRLCLAGDYELIKERRRFEEK